MKTASACVPTGGFPQNKKSAEIQKKLLICAADFDIIGTDNINMIFRTGSEVMISRDVTIKNNVGLHARPATFFIQKANSFKSSIWVEKEDRRVNAKSLLGVLSLGVTQGEAITVAANGSDEKEAVDSLVDLVSTNFAE